METQTLIVFILATYALTRTIVEDAGLQKTKTKLWITLKQKRSTSNLPTRTMINLAYRLVAWPYWTAIPVMAVIYLCSDPARNFLGAIGGIYLIYDLRQN